MLASVWNQDDRLRIRIQYVRIRILHLPNRNEILIRIMRIIMPHFHRKYEKLCLLFLYFLKYLKAAQV
jgi:hypothetical protein